MLFVMISSTPSSARSSSSGMKVRPVVLAAKVARAVFTFVCINATFLVSVITSSAPVRTSRTVGVAPAIVLTVTKVSDVVLAIGVIKTTPSFTAPVSNAQRTIILLSCCVISPNSSASVATSVPALRISAICSLVSLCFL